MRIIHPYSDLTGGQWLRGNLHTHTTRSDGQRPLQAVIDDYASRGYGFLMLSDHDVYNSPEDYAQVEAKGLVLIPGTEITANGVHLLHVNANRLVTPDADRQKVIDEINSSAGGFAIVNHPNWYPQFDHCVQENLVNWQGYKGIEIYNGVIGRLEGSQYATDRWDRLLTLGRRVWGYANDDCHAAVGDIELGWNVAYVKDRSVAGVVDALANGRFYCSTGVIINRIEVAGSRIRIETQNADRIIAYTWGQRRCKVVDGSTLVGEVSLEDASTNTYVRFECCGRGEQFAWTQPFYIEK